MKSALIVLMLGVFLLPFGAGATSFCSSDGYTIVFVNGIFTDLEEAGVSENRLQKEYNKYGNHSDITIALAHNETHIGGAGDIAQSILQAIAAPINIADRDDMLRQIQLDVSTQKILLVGHSQGTFYTNEIYEYLTDNGYPKESIGVYNVASVAGFVAGNKSPYDGKYLTSSNDGVVDFVRGVTAPVAISDVEQVSPYSVGILGAAGPSLKAIQTPLPANINILHQASDPRTRANIFSGHAFSGVYLAGAAPRIVREIDTALDGLSARASVTAESGCFNPPKETIAYRVDKFILDTGDLMAFVGKTIAGTGNVAAQMIGQGIIDTGSVIKTVTVSTGTWVFNNTKELVADMAGGLGEFWGMAVNRIAPEGDLGYLEANTFALLGPEEPTEPEFLKPDALEPSASGEADDVFVLDDDEPEAIEVVPPAEDAEQLVEEPDEDPVDNFAPALQGVGEPEVIVQEGVQEEQEIIEPETEEVILDGVGGAPHKDQAPKDTVPNESETDEQETVVPISTSAPEPAPAPKTQPSAWGIKTGGSGRKAQTNVVAVPKIFSPTVASVTEEDKEDITITMQAFIGGKDTVLMVWSEDARTDVDGTMYDDTLILGRRIRSDGSWVDIEPIVLSDPSAGHRRFSIVGIENDGEFVILMSTYDLTWSVGDSSNPHGVNIVRIPTNGSAGEINEVTLFETSYTRSGGGNAPTVYDIASMGDDLFVLWGQGRYSLMGGILTDENTIQRKTVVRDGRPEGAEVTCTETDCFVVWGTRYGIRTGSFDMTDETWWKNDRNCEGFSSRCPGALVAPTKRAQFNGGMKNQVLFVGEDDILVAWTAEDEFIYGKRFKRGDVVDSNWDDIKGSEMLSLGEHTGDIRYLTTAPLPDSEDILLVTTPIGTQEMIVAVMRDTDETLTLGTVPDVTVMWSFGVACTEAGCFVGWKGEYGDVSGIHVVEALDLLMAEAPAVE